jgi:hypothetical protein
MAKSLKQKLKGESGWCLVREGSHVDAPPLATFSDDEGSGLRSKTKMGVFESKDQAQSKIWAINGRPLR